MERALSKSRSSPQMPGQTFTLAESWPIDGLCLPVDEEMGELAEWLTIASLAIILLAVLFWCVRLPYR